MKKRLLVLVTLSIVPTIILGQENIESDTNHCVYTNTIQGSTDIQAGTERTYNATLEGSGGVLTTPSQWSDNSFFRIVYDGVEVAHFPNVSSFSYRFAEPGLYTVTHEVTYQECDIITSATITAYAHSITYIGAPRPDLDDSIINNLKQRNILLSSIPMTVNNSDLSIKKTDITDSELIIIDTSPSVSLQQIFAQIDIPVGSGSATTYATISDASPNLSKKILGSITRTISQPVRIINSDTMEELILLWRTGERERATQIINQAPQANQQNTTSFGFNSFVDTLLYQGVPLPIIASMLTLVAVTVLLIFLRQVIGLNVFSIYYPILGAITLLLIGNKLFAIFMIVARISHRITYLTSRRFHVLIHAKVGIYLTIYTIISIFALRMMTLIDPTIQRSYIQNIGTRSVLIGFFSIAIIGQKIFENKKDLTRHITDILMYFVVMLPITLILRSLNIQYWMITHTWIVFLAIIMAFILGRFTGMKLLEYQRFGKLLWKEFKRK